MTNIRLLAIFLLPMSCSNERDFLGVSNSNPAKENAESNPEPNFTPGENSKLNGKSEDLFGDGTSLENEGDSVNAFNGGDGDAGLQVTKFRVECTAWKYGRPMPYTSVDPYALKTASAGQCLDLCKNDILERGEVDKTYTCLRHINGDCHRYALGHNSVVKNTNPYHDCDGCQTNFCETVPDE